MGEFLRLVSPAEARSILLGQLASPLDENEVIPTSEALHRATAEDIAAPHPLPEFARTTVDGYAVQARDTFGATSSLPSYLQVVGEVPMGESPAFTLGAGQCAMIHTGGMLPPGADAVVMLEHSSAVKDQTAEHRGLSEVEILRPAAPGENVLSIGEDVKAGQIVIGRGTRVRPAEIGGLMALGLTAVRVVRKPIVGLISSGDEVVPPDVQPRRGQVRDVNAYALAALVTEAGGSPVLHGIVPDAAAQAEGAARTAAAESDVVVITAGSSASTRDLTSSVISALGPPGVLVHGINIRPGKPTILGVCDGKAVVGLPGNPVSALVVARLLLVPIISSLLGVRDEKPRPTIRARLNVNLASQAGREDWWPVRLRQGVDGNAGWEADPVFGRSNLIFSLVAADGLVCIPAAKSGLQAGETVEVEAF